MVEICCCCVCVRGVFYGDLYCCGQFCNVFFFLSVGFFGKGVNLLGLFCNGVVVVFCYVVQYILCKMEVVRGDVQFVVSGQSCLCLVLCVVVGGGCGFGDIGYVVVKIL